MISCVREQQICLGAFFKSLHLTEQGFHSTPDPLHNISSCISWIKHVVMLRVGGLGCELEFPVLSSAELLTVMVKLTMRRIMFPFWPSSDFSSPPCSGGGLIVISWQSVSNHPPSVYVMFCSLFSTGDIYKRRHGTSCTAPTCFPGVSVQSLCLGNCLALELISSHADRIL